MAGRPAMMVCFWDFPFEDGIAYSVVKSGGRQGYRSPIKRRAMFVDIVRSVSGASFAFLAVAVAGAGRAGDVNAIEILLDCVPGYVRYLQAQTIGDPSEIVFLLTRYSHVQCCIPIFVIRAHAFSPATYSIARAICPGKKIS